MTEDDRWEIALILADGPYDGYDSWEQQAAYEWLCHRCGADYGCCEHTNEAGAE